MIYYSLESIRIEIRSQNKDECEMKVNPPDKFLITVMLNTSNVISTRLLEVTVLHLLCMGLQPSVKQPRHFPINVLGDNDKQPMAY